MDDSEDSIEFNTGGGLTYREIVMAQFSRITSFCNVEFRGGFYTRLPMKDGSDKLIYTPDTREVFSNAVYGLAILIQPKFDDDMKHSFDKVRNALKQIGKEFMDKTTVKETVILGESFYTEDKDRIALEEYKNKKLDLFMALFTKLSQLLAKRNYLEIGGGTF